MALDFASSVLDESSTATKPRYSSQFEPGTTDDTKAKLGLAIKDPAERAHYFSTLYGQGSSSGSLSGASSILDEGISKSAPTYQTPSSYVEPPKTPSLLDRGLSMAGKGLDMLNPFGNFAQGAREGLASLATGAGAAVAGGAGALYEGLKNPTDEAGWKRAADIARGITEQYTYQPKSEGANAVMQSPWNPMQALSHSTEDLGSSIGAIADKLGASPETSAKFATAAATIPNAALAFAGGLKGAPAENAPMRGAPAAWNKPPAPIAQPVATTGNNALGSVGAAGRSAADVIASDLQNASPQLKEAFANKDLSALTPEQGATLANHIDADKLYVPGKLTEGQARENSTLHANEFNNRKKIEWIADRYDEQQQNLKDNLIATHDVVSPDVPMHGTPASYGRMTVDGLVRAHDANHAVVQQAYQTFKNAAGDWKAPIDGLSIADAADAALEGANKSAYIRKMAPAIREQLDTMRSGEAMTIGQYENLRTNLADDMRSATNSGLIKALSIVRDATENMPLTGEAATLKPLADAARAAAKSEFDLQKSVPAYGDVANAAGDPQFRSKVNEDALQRVADRLIERRVVDGGSNDLRGMISLVGDGSIAHQAMSTGMLEHLGKSASLTNGDGIFRQSGYNKAVARQADKLHDLFGPESSEQVQRIGRVARLQQEQGTGGVHMNSGSGIAVAELGDKLRENMANAAATAADVALAAGTKGGSVALLGPSPIKGMMKASQLKKAEAAEAAAKTDYARRVLEPGAGVRLRDMDK